LASFSKGLTLDNVRQARGFYERALSADPYNVEALIGSARADATAANLLFVSDRAATLFAAEAKVASLSSPVSGDAATVQRAAGERAA
jgi:hypothetical protein